MGEASEHCYAAKSHVQRGLSSCSIQTNRSHPLISDPHDHRLRHSNGLGNPYHVLASLMRNSVIGESLRLLAELLHSKDMAQSLAFPFCNGIGSTKHDLHSNYSLVSVAFESECSNSPSEAAFLIRLG